MVAALWLWSKRRLRSWPRYVANPAVAYGTSQLKAQRQTDMKWPVATSLAFLHVDVSFFFLILISSLQDKAAGIAVWAHQLVASLN